MASRARVDLAASDDDAARLTRAARAAVAVDRSLARRLHPALAQLSADRELLLRATPPRQRPRHARAHRVTVGELVWVALLGLGLLGAVVLAAMIGMPRRSYTLDVELALPAAVVGGLVAALCLGSALAGAPRVRDPRLVPGAMVCSLIVGILLAVSAGFRLWAGAGSGAEYTAAQRGGLVTAGVLLAALLGVLARVLRDRAALVGALGRGSAATRERRRRDAARELRHRAHVLAASAPRNAAAGDAVERAWTSAIEEMSLPTSTVRQARELGPVAWIVWAHHRGDPTS